jgi:2-keto-3-deoxy-galactonokinase
LIGLELKELLPKKNTKIILVSNKTLEPYYTIAFAQLGLDRNLPVRNADQAILRGHYKIYEQCQFLLSR